MRKYKTFLTSVAILFFMALSITGCKKSPDELLKDCGPGVVMVVNQYYYKLMLPTGKEWYFTGFDTNGEMQNFTLDQEEIEKSKAMLTGTGFFVSDDGKILTNRHVATPTIDFSNARHSVKNVLSSMKQMVRYEMQQLSAQYDQLESQKNDCYGYDYYGELTVDQEKLDEITAQQQQLTEAYNSDVETCNQIDNIDVNDIKIEPVYDVYVAFNNTFVTKMTDLAPCVVTSVSKDAEVDLAMLQLKNKRTPDTATVIELAKEDKELKPGEPLYMIGFNAGFSLSNTSQGIKAQITSGNISQVSDNTKIMYTIPALPGSSGSPVLDEYGKLVAVNFAGISTTQSFNYGIHLKKVRRFMSEN